MPVFFFCTMHSFALPVLLTVTHAEQYARVVGSMCWLVSCENLFGRLSLGLARCLTQDWLTCAWCVMAVLPSLSGVQVFFRMQQGLQKPMLLFPLLLCCDCLCTASLLKVILPHEPCHSCVSA